MSIAPSIFSALRICRVPAAAFVTLGAFWGCFAASAPVIKDRVGADDATFGLLLLGTAIGLASTMWLAPRFDAQLRANALPLACAMLAGAFLLPGHVSSPLALFLVMMLVGMCSGLVDVVMNARVSELEVAHTRSLMNANHGMFSLGYAIGALATGLAREVGLAPADIFLTVSVASLALIPFMRGAVSAPEVAETTISGGLSWALIGLAGGVVLVAFTAEAAVEAWSALHIERTLGGRAAEGALGPALLGLTMTMGRFYGQTVTERFSDYTVIEVAGIITIIGALTAALAPTPLVAYVGFMLLGLGVSVIGPLGIAAAGRMAPPQHRTRAVARVAVIGFLGFFVAPAVMGGISALWGLRISFVAVALILCALPALTWALRGYEGKIPANPKPFSRS